MTQIDTDLYKTIADAYALIDGNLSGTATNARTALDAIVDVDTATYPDSQPSINDPDAALEIELALLTPFNTAFISAQNISASVGFLLDAVRSVNNHVIANSNKASGTSTVKLDNWINVDMDTTWTDECPVGWSNLSSDAGYDVTNWVTSAT